MSLTPAQSSSRTNSWLSQAAQKSVFRLRSDGFSPDDGLTGNHFGPEVGFEEIIPLNSPDLPEARLWIACGTLRIPGAPETRSSVD